MPRFMVLALLFVIALSGLALAQEPGEDHAVVVFDAAVAPLLQPEVDDYIAADDTEARAADASVAVSAYTEVTDQLSLFSLAPRFKLTDQLRAKVRVPWILQRKFNYFGHEATGSGLGDISVDLAYRRPLGDGRQRVEFTASVKLPTGDDENVDDDDYAVPLGTGSVDLMARGQYARNTETMGLLVNGLFRLNSASDVTTEYASGIPGEMVRSTASTTNGNQFSASAFGRYKAGEKLWVHLGAAITVTGDGDVETETVDPVSGTSTSTIDLEQAGTLLDLFPGVSYQLGMLQPYLGLRLPVVTSFDNEFLGDKRDTAVVLQVTYNPARFLAD